MISRKQALRFTSIITALRCLETEYKWDFSLQELSDFARELHRILNITSFGGISKKLWKEIFTECAHNMGWTEFKRIKNNELRSFICNIHEDFQSPDQLAPYLRKIGLLSGIKKSTPDVWGDVDENF